MTPGVCRAKTPDSCRFKEDDGTPMPHYDSAEKAAEAAEKNLDKLYANIKTFKTKSKASKKQNNDRIEPFMLNSSMTDEQIIERNSLIHKAASKLDDRGFDIIDKFGDNGSIVSSEAAQQIVDEIMYEEKQSTWLNQEAKSEFFNTLHELKNLNSSQTTKAKPKKETSPKEPIEETIGRYYDRTVPYHEKDNVEKRDKYIKASKKDAKLKKEIQEWSEARDLKGNTTYKGLNTIEDNVTVDGIEFNRIKAGTYAGAPYSFRFQVGKELTKEESEQLAGVIGYAYRKTGGEPTYGYEQDSPNSIVVFADTTKGRAYKRLDEFLEDVPEMIKNGSPVRKTDRAGAGTKGTQLVSGLGDLGYLEVYADDVSEPQDLTDIHKLN